MVVALMPLLLVAEQGRTWGWGSAGAITCYVIGALGIIAFLVIETLMKDDAIIPLKLFRSGTFSMATLLGFLVGFGMFGAMMTIPLYLQIVTGLTPTESGFAMLPMIIGLMIASIASGQIVAKTGKYRVFPIIGTALTACGYFVLTYMTIDRPLWFLMIGMFLIGLGLGQLMQSLTLASQGSVAPKDMGVATSSSTFFRQIGGTLGTAVLLSVLFSVMPTNIQTAMANKTDLTSALDAALTPSVATAPENKGDMKQIWNPEVTPVKKSVQTELDSGTKAAKAAADAAVTKQVTAAVEAQVAAGTVPAAAADQIIDQQVAAATPQAEKTALAAAAKKADVSVRDGKLVVNYADASQRSAIVDKVAPKLAKTIKNGSGTSANTSDASTSDTAYLSGADSRLTRPFMTGFNNSALSVYWVGLAVILIAFILTWFFRVPVLRKQSALQEQADEAGTADDLEAGAVAAATAMGSPTAPGTGSIPVHRS